MQIPDKFALQSNQSHGWLTISVSSGFSTAATNSPADTYAQFSQAQVAKLNRHPLNQPAPYTVFRIVSDPATERITLEPVDDAVFNTNPNQLSLF